MKALSYDLINGGVAKTNEIIIDGKTPVTSDTFSKKNKTYIISTKINPSSETTYLVGENSVLQFTKNGQFGENCIIDSEEPIEIKAGLHKIFNGRIKAFIKNPIVYPEWWGAVGDGMTDSAEAINKCVIAAKRNTVLLGQGFYRVASSAIIISETQSEIERYQELGLSWPEGTSETFWVWQTQSGIEEKRRNFICNGSLIGDENLDGPVLYLNGCSQINLYVHTIYVRSETVGSCGLLIANVGGDADIKIGTILKESNDRTNGETRNHTGEGSGIVLCSGVQKSHFSVRQISGFRNGFVLTDAKGRDTYVNGATVGLTGLTTKASHMCNVFDLGHINAINPMIWDLRVSNSYINCNEINVIQLETTNQGTAFKLLKENGNGQTTGNKLTINVPDVTNCGKYFDIYGFDNGIINVHGNVQDIIVNGTNVTDKLNSVDAKIFKFTQCYDTQINPSGNIFIDCFEFIKCSNVAIKNAWCSETTYSGSYNPLRSDPQIGYGITKLSKKPIFDVDVSVLEDITSRTGIATSATVNTAIIFKFRPRWEHQLQEVNATTDIPTVTESSNLFYVVTATEYGDTIKLYPLYDSLKRQVGYVYKNSIV